MFLNNSFWRPEQPDKQPNNANSKLECSSGWVSHLTSHDFQLEFEATASECENAAIVACGAQIPPTAPQEASKDMHR